MRDVEEKRNRAFLHAFANVRVALESSSLKATFKRVDRLHSWIFISHHVTNGGDARIYNVHASKIDATALSIYPRDVRYVPRRPQLHTIPLASPCARARVSSPRDCTKLRNLAPVTLRLRIASNPLMRNESIFKWQIDTADLTNARKRRRFATSIYLLSTSFRLSFFFKLTMNMPRRKS